MTLTQACLGQPGTLGTSFQFNHLTCPNCDWKSLGHLGQVPLVRWLSQVVPTLSQVPKVTHDSVNIRLFQLSNLYQPKSKSRRACGAPINSSQPKEGVI